MMKYDGKFKNLFKNDKNNLKFYFNEEHALFSFLSFMAST